MAFDPEFPTSSSPEAGLRLVARLAAQIAEAPWALVAGGAEPVWSGAPPAAIAAAVVALGAPAEGRVAVAPLAAGAGWAAVAALPGRRGALAAAAPGRIELDGAARAEFAEAARLAAALLEADGAARARDLIRLALDHMDQGLVVVEPNLSVPVLSRRAIELLSLPEAFLATRPNFADIVAFQRAEGVVVAESIVAWYDEYLRKRGRAPEAEVYERVTPEGRTLEVRTTRLPGGGFARTYTDQTARRRREAEAERLGWQDALTGLDNRSSFMRRLEGALAAGDPLAVVLLDLDRFKAVNDTLGHLAGDELLQVIGARIAALVGAGDVAARFGGDEFALVLPGADAATAAAVAERALGAVQAPATIAGREVALGASIGVALAPQDGIDPTGLIKAADMALYRAKGEGRYAWRAFAPEMAAEVEARRRLELDLRAALDRREFALTYQPVIDVESGRPVGYEALMRWTHAEHGAVPPEEFIAIAEEARLIGQIGAWALARACADAARWPRGRDLWVNVSAVQLAHGAFEDELDAALAASGFAPRRLVVEITETSLMEGRADLAPLLARLRARGVRIALDDFGTGYSSLGYLRRFPFDVIKIDRSFVRELDEPETAAIVTSVLDLARRLGIATVAEGVESEAQLDRLRAAHCGFVQGHFFGPALAASAIGA